MNYFFLPLFKKKKKIQPALSKVQFNGYHAAYCITVAQMLFFVMLPDIFKKQKGGREFILFGNEYVEPISLKKV